MPGPSAQGFHPDDARPLTNDLGDTRRREKPCNGLQQQAKGALTRPHHRTLS